MKYEGGYRQAIEDFLVETSATVFSLYHTCDWLGVPKVGGWGRLELLSSRAASACGSHPHSQVIDWLVSELVETVIALAMRQFAERLPKTQRKKSSSAVSW